MSDRNGTALAERGKQKISAAQAIELVKKFVKDRFKEDSAASSRALAEADRIAGGQTERLDKDVVDQGRAWATRLALISRRTAGTGYQVSKTSAAITPIVKKLFALIGELEAVMATDVEISLWSPAKREDYFANTYGNNPSLATLTVATVLKGYDHLEPGDTVDEDTIVDTIQDLVGERMTDAVAELLGQYEIEPVVIPGEPKEDGEGKKPRRRARR